jgi:hypothetical protein
MATRQPDKNYYDLYRIQKDKRRREMQEIDRLDRKLGKLSSDGLIQSKTGLHRPSWSTSCSPPGC